MRHVVIGTIGFFSSVTLSQWSDAASLLAGLATTVYMGICIFQKVHKHKRK